MKKLQKSELISLPFSLQRILPIKKKKLSFDSFGRYLRRQSEIRRLIQVWWHRESCNNFEVKAAPLEADRSWICDEDTDHKFSW